MRVRERPGDRLADPPGRVRRELEALAVVELLGGAYEPDRPLLDQVEERQPLVPVALRDRDDEAQVRLDHLLLGTVVAALDALGELDLLGCSEQVDLADVLQEELQRVGGDLAHLGALLLWTGEVRKGAAQFRIAVRDDPRSPFADVARQFLSIIPTNGTK